MGTLALAVIVYVRALVVPRHKLALEAAALRQQLVVFKRKQARPKSHRLDRVRSRFRRPGRPKVSQEIRHLIRRMKVDNPIWGAVDTENSVRIENPGFRSIREIKTGQQVLAHVTLLLRALPRCHLRGDRVLATDSSRQGPPPVQTPASVFNGWKILNPIESNFRLSGGLTIVSD